MNLEDRTGIQDQSSKPNWRFSTIEFRPQDNRRAWTNHKMLSTTMIVGLLFLLSGRWSFCSQFHLGTSGTAIEGRAEIDARAVSPSLQEVFQVYPPVLTVMPQGGLAITDGSANASAQIIENNLPKCQELLVVHTFAYSYGMPYVGAYSPPSCSFNRATWNLTVTSQGRQFDRLGTVFLGDIEVFRTSTAEPTQNGIEWTYLKDMTSFTSLLKQDQKIIFDLGNLVDNTYTGVFNVTLTGAYFNADDSITPADVILPVSARKSAQGMASTFTVPGDTATNSLTLPRNIKKAVFTISATGQQQEEFWWSNVLQSDVNAFPSSGTLYGYSPFREVQLYIDDELAGVAWPFPIIFTGGVVPGLWRPIVGIDVFDLQEDEIDITPWLPLLCDGKPHSFTIRVSGLNDDGHGTARLSETTDNYWLVTGKVFVWLDAAGHVTTGLAPARLTPDPQFQVSSSTQPSTNGSTNGTLLYRVSAQRQLSVQSVINLSQGPQIAWWQQSLTFSNSGNFTDGGNVEINNQQTSGTAVSSNGYARRFSYPLYAYSTYASTSDGFTLGANINRGKDILTLGEPVFPSGLESFAETTSVHPQFGQLQGVSLSTTQNGSATYTTNQTASTARSFGTTTQDMTFSGINVGSTLASNSSSPPLQQAFFPSIKGSTEYFRRHARAVNGSITDDQETLLGVAVPHAHGTPPPDASSEYALDSLPGRGGRWHGGLQTRNV